MNPEFLNNWFPDEIPKPVNKCISYPRGQETFVIIGGQHFFKEQVCGNMDIIEKLIEEKKLKRDDPKKYCLECNSEERIELCTFLGQGAFNQVYSIKYQLDKVMRITKIELNEIEKENEIKGLFMQKYLSDLEGEGKEYICKVYDFGYLINTRGDKEHVYAILERVTVDLFDLRANRERHNSENMNLRRYFRQVLTGLKHMNKNGFVHLDMKNENVGIVIVNKDGINEGYAKIFDFGFATHLEGFVDVNETPGLFDILSTSIFPTPKFIEKNPFGNPIYQDPHFSITKKIYINFDVFSVGLMILVAYFRLNRKFTQYFNLGISWWDQIQYETAVEDKTILVDLIKKMINPNPLERIQSKEALLHSWFNTGETEDASINYPSAKEECYGPSSEPLEQPPRVKPKPESRVGRAKREIANAFGLNGGGTLKKRKYNRRTKRNRKKTRSSK
jgi:serine/threonine protein kinase